jgi:hypothetical protein
MATSRLSEFLNVHRISYIALEYPEALSALDVVSVTHTELREVARAAIIRADEFLAMTVPTASPNVIVEMFKAMMWADPLRLAGESTLQKRLPDCDEGAMLSCGSRYGEQVYADDLVSGDKKWAIEAGNHQKPLRSAYANLATSRRPAIRRLSNLCTLFCTEPTATAQDSYNCHGQEV